MEERAFGLILRTRPLTETSLIVNWITPDLGRVSTVAKGARRPKSPFRGKLDLFYLCEFTFARSRRSDLHSLREVSLRETHSALRRELGWLEQASYAAGLLEQTTETATPLPEFFALLFGFLRHLTEHPPQPQTVFAFELNLLRELGQAPRWGETSLSAGSRRIAEHLATDGWEQLLLLKPSRDQLRELGQFLHGFLIYHLGRIPPGRAAALNG